MTKEEAIKYLQQLYPNGGHCWLDEQRMEAIDMAVKALQEEPKPKFKKGDTIRYTDGDIRTVVEVREDCYKLDDFSILHFNAQDNWELVREPVSNDFEMTLAEMIDKAQTSVVEPLVVAAQWKDELIKLAKSEEPVSEEWIEELRTKLDSMSKEDFKKVFDKYAVDFNEETVSDDLEEAANFYADMHTEWFDADNNPHVSPAFKAGAKWQKEQMMKDAVEGVITFDYYGDGDKTYGCIAHDSFCLEDMGLKDGDKVKLIIIKED